MRAVRVTVSTIALVALLRQSWVPVAAFPVAWLLILGSPRVFPLFLDPAEAPRKQGSPLGLCAQARSLVIARDVTGADPRECSTDGPHLDRGSHWFAENSPRPAWSTWR